MSKELGYYVFDGRTIVNVAWWQLPRVVDEISDYAPPAEPVLPMPNYGRPLIDEMSNEEIEAAIAAEVYTPATYRQRSE
jgi:hypothetical protein